MEHALFINNLNNLEFFDRKKYQRLYFGTEFCENIFPTAEEIDAAVRFCSRNSIDFTLVTPWCLEKGLQAVRNAIKIVPKNSEVVFNDWGVFGLIKHKQILPVLGRLLVSIKRDPRFARGDGHSAQLSNLNNNEFQRYILSKKIRRISLDNVIQGYNFILSKKISSSLHYPYVYITTSRKCLPANVRRCGKIKISKCGLECGNYTITADIPGGKQKIIIKGNSQFYINNKRPDNFNKLNIDRLIFSPRVPGGMN